MFKIGQPIICIFDAWHPAEQGKVIDPRWRMPKKGKKYEHDGYSGSVMTPVGMIRFIWLKGFFDINPQTGSRISFQEDCFRPVQFTDSAIEELVKNQIFIERETERELKIPVENKKPFLAWLRNSK